MRLGEALAINARVTERSRDLHLVCGFSPLHLQTFLAAHSRARVHAGLFGDLEGNLRRAAEAGGDGAAVVIEWTDLDPRLGLRASAGWSAGTLDEILREAPEACRRLEARIAEIAMPAAVALPSLILPPLTHFPPVEASPFEARLEAVKADFAARLAERRGVRVINQARLPVPRHDAKLELHAGFPYTAEFADALAAAFCACLFPEGPKKGIITDLDETLWRGILGDAGVAGVAWGLETHAQGHALYQQLLASLAESGALVAVASKNDPELVRQAFARPDILLKASQVFPVEAGWGRKSEAVGRILKAWNIGADSVVFVDDSPMELGEVAERYPGIECVPFPSGDAGIPDLLLRLRTLFGKAEVREEDRVRTESLRQSARMEEERGGADAGDFIARLGARIAIQYETEPAAGRAFELINKTNQFNLNGRRFTEGDWAAYFRQPGAFLMTAAYEDRFGPLGTIGALAGRAADGCVDVDVWVLSCRAFSRHIEYQMLRQVFARFAAGAVRFAFQATERNGPLRDFLSQFGGTEEMRADAFERACPPLYHEVKDSWTRSERSSPAVSH